VGALIFRRGSILLVERGREPLKGWWSLPGGLVETGELLATAVRREVFEETGLVVKPVRLSELFERIMRDASGQPEYHYVLADYLCTVVSGELRPGDDVSRVAWVKRGALGGYQLTEGTRDVIEKAFAGRQTAVGQSDARRKRS
jgi:8-oxo-dGTP diphosphatase